LCILTAEIVIMKKLLALLFLFSFFIACKSTKKEKKFDTDSYEKVKETLADKEKNNPSKFLIASTRDRKNLIGQTVVITNITNTATVCWYKDIEIKVSFYSKTGVKLDEGTETVYENIGPGKTVKYKTRYFTPKGTDSATVIILKATASLTK
jgi:hypothetical protein